jgi:hypothetical protein
MVSDQASFVQGFSLFVSDRTPLECSQFLAAKLRAIFGTFDPCPLGMDQILSCRESCTGKKKGKLVSWKGSGR